MATSQVGEVFQVATNKALTETGGGHGQKGVDFQRAWALSRMFEIEDSGATDFLFLFEAIQDVAVLDSPTKPTTIIRQSSSQEVVALMMSLIHFGLRPPIITEWAVGA